MVNIYPKQLPKKWKIEIKATKTTVTKLSLKYYSMSEGNTSMAEPKLEVLLHLIL